MQVKNGDRPLRLCDVKSCEKELIQLEQYRYSYIF